MASTAQAGASKSAKLQPRTQKITTFLWFDNNAEEAVNFYVSTFKNSKSKNAKILSSMPFTAAGPGPEGSVMMMEFELDGVVFTALNGGPQFKFNEAASLMIHCQTQDEIDYFWEKLSEGGGKTIECGWLQDKFGLFWQITPDMIFEMYQDPDRQKAERVMRAMMKMKKLDIEQLQQAAQG